MPRPESTRQRKRAHSHLINLEKLRKAPEKEPKQPPLSDLSVFSVALEKQRVLNRISKLEGYGAENRDQLTKGEQAMKAILREIGWRFNIEHPIHNYILDFYVHAHRLAIEVDGGYHETKIQKAKDRARDGWLVRHGYKVLRLTNQQVIDFPRKTRASILAIIVPRKRRTVFARVIPLNIQLHTKQEAALKAMQRKYHLPPAD